MSGWKIVYLLGIAAWLTYLVPKVAKKITDGSVKYWPEATRRTRTFLFVAMFWNTVCAAVLWPGSLVLQLYGLMVEHLDAQEGGDE